MRRVIPLVALILFAVSIAGASAQQDAALSEAQFAVGVVFHDANANGVRDRGEKGIPGVRVSNGRTSSVTDRSGSYRLPVTDDTVIFVVKPRNWTPAVDANQVPRFCYVHKPKGSPELKFKGVAPTGPLPASVDFPLYPNPEPDRFSVLMLGDTQVNSLQDIAYLARDIIEELVGTDASFAVSLGDVVNNDLSLYEPLLPVMGKLGIPCFYVKGNHDTNYDAGSNQKLTDETWERVFGPSYYSFDYGPVHFIVLDNPYFVAEKKYEARIELEQMAFVRHDLASIPKDQLVVLMMHIPIYDMLDRKELFGLLSSHPNTFSISAHRHINRHVFVTETEDWGGAKPHHHLVNVTACGAWWSGWPDELQIPHTTMKDGTPNGYSIVTFDGKSYSVKYKAARRPADYQMNIHGPDIVDAAKAGETEILANVFAGSEKSVVDMRLGEKGNWIRMEQVEVEDPAIVAAKKLEDSYEKHPTKRIPSTDISRHIWRANLPLDAAPGTHLIQVRTTDMFGQTYWGNRVITVR